MIHDHFLIYFMEYISYKHNNNNKPTYIDENREYTTLKKNVRMINQLYITSVNC